MTGGSDALGEVTVRIREEKEGKEEEDDKDERPIFHGHGADSDILTASAMVFFYLHLLFISINP